MNCKLVVGAFLLGLQSLAANATDRVLFQFDSAEKAKAWQTVNDTVMGGRSVGAFRINADRNMEFFGSLSLQNNGGFASVRARGRDLKLKQGDVIVARVKGDGRQYSFNLYAEPNLRGYSYRQSFRTKKDQWIEVELPLSKCVATWRGRVYPNQALVPGNVAGVGFLLGDKRAGPFKLEVQWIKVRDPARKLVEISCEGTYPNHLQGICSDENFIFWSFTTTIVKTDMKGVVLASVPVANHHGDLCMRDGKLYVAVNLGKFNDPNGNADSWIYVYDAKTLAELQRHDTPEVFHGAGGIGFRNDRFFIVGGLPEKVDENYVYEFDAKFEFVRKHSIQSGHTHLGIQTAAFAHDRWWFGCYGDPKILLVTNSEFSLISRQPFDCSLGIEGMTDGRLLVATGQCDPKSGCTGAAVVLPIPSELSSLSN